MANQNAIQDDNKWYGLIGHTGTAGTSETRRLVVDTDGNLMVNIAAGESINIGTLNLGTIELLKAGTITTLSNLSNGTIRVTAGTITAGTIDLLKAGTLNYLGTVGTIQSISGTTKVEDANYDIKIEDANSTTTYYGYAPLGQGTNTAGTVWRIMRKIYDSTASTYLYAGGTDTFINPWDGRGTLTYS